MPMTHAEWLDEVTKRIAISEGCELRRYYDTNGIPTIGIGFNLNRSDAYGALQTVGVADPAPVLAGTATITQAQADALFHYAFAPIEFEARQSLINGTYDALSDARRFVICDLVYNLGEEGWGEFQTSRDLIASAQMAKTLGSVDAHAKFVLAAAHLRFTEWYTEVGDRAKRDCAMLQQGVWCSPTGDGSDIV